MKSARIEEGTASRVGRSHPDPCQRASFEEQEQDEDDDQYREVHEPHQSKGLGKPLAEPPPMSAPTPCPETMATVEAKAARPWS